MMMIGGAVGFYLGIDTPPLAFHAADGRPSTAGSSGKVDSAEFLSAVGTFLAALSAFVSVIAIVFREDPHIYWTRMIMLGWVVGVLMQIIAGAIDATALDGPVQPPGAYRIPIGLAHLLEVTRHERSSHSWND
jgi:hypothetical protein